MKKQDAIKALEEILDPGAWSSIRAILTNDEEEFQDFEEDEGLQLLNEVCKQFRDLTEDSRDAHRAVQKARRKLEDAEQKEIKAKASAEEEEAKAAARAKAEELYGSDEIQVYPEDGVDLSPDEGSWVTAQLWVPNEED